MQDDEQKAREILANLEVKDGSEDEESGSEKKAVIIFPFEVIFVLSLCNPYLLC